MCRVINLQRLQFGHVHVYIPGGEELGCERNSALEICLRRLGGCRCANTTFVSLKAVMSLSSSMFSRSWLDSSTMFLLFILLLYVVTKGSVRFLCFGFGPGPCSLALCVPFQITFSGKPHARSQPLNSFIRSSSLS